MPKSIFLWSFNLIITVGVGVLFTEYSYACDPQKHMGKFSTQADEYLKRQDYIDKKSNIITHQKLAQLYDVPGWNKEKAKDYYKKITLFIFSEHLGRVNNLTEEARQIRDMWKQGDTEVCEKIDQYLEKLLPMLKESSVNWNKVHYLIDKKVTDGKPQQE